MAIGNGQRQVQSAFRLGRDRGHVASQQGGHLVTSSFLENVVCLGRAPGANEKKVVKKHTIPHFWIGGVVVLKGLSRVTSVYKWVVGSRVVLVAARCEHQERREPYGETRIYHALLFLPERRLRHDGLWIVGSFRGVASPALWIVGLESTVIGCMFSWRFGSIAPPIGLSFIPSPALWIVGSFRRLPALRCGSREGSSP